MILYPNLYYESIKSIPISKLEELGIKGVVLDVDNTIIDLNKKMPDGVKEWIEEAKAKKIKFCILSNTNKKDKVEKVSKDLDIPFFFFAKKPLQSGFKKVQNLLRMNKFEMASIGDQIFTDVLGANLFGIKSIFVEPISKEDYWFTKIKRPIERFVIKSYLKREGKK